MQIKNALLNNNIHIWAGYEFKDADFSPFSLIRTTNYLIGVKLKIINNFEQIDLTLNKINNHKELYQFYIKKPFYNRSDTMGADIQLQNTIDLLKII